MQETPRLRETSGDTKPVTPHHRHCSALAHTTAVAASSGEPRRSIGRSFQTPRDARHEDRIGRLGTLPPVPGRSPYLPALCVLLFSFLTWQEAVRGPVLALDPRLRSAIAGTSVRPGPRAEVWYFLSDLGSTRIAVPVLVAAVVFAVWRGRRWLPSVVCAVAMAAVPAVVVPLKAAIGRSGPGSLALAAGYPGLYPSGHTATAAIAYGAAALLLVPFVRRAAARRVLVTATIALNLLVGVSLVYCGYHWPLDVVGSWLLCGALLWGAANAIGRFSINCPSEKRS